MSFLSSRGENDLLMNNADSFAISFDEAWKKSISNLSEKELDCEKKISITLKQMSDHPFLANNPDAARQIAKFRIKLLNLD